MGNSIAPPAARPAGVVRHALSGSVIEIEEQNGRMIHRLSENGFTSEFSIDYQIGNGLAGFSYLVRIGDYIFESPASWYNQHGWDVSPGFGNLPGLDFTRGITSDCLFCHTGATKFADPDGRKLASATLVPITCERCHGPTENHLRRPVPGSIVNPAKLTGQKRDSVCAQCHLEGEARVPNPGKAFTDFRAGQDLADVLAIYVDSGAEAGANVVNHFEQLAESHCARQSAGRLWCGSCHDPHGEPADRVTQIRNVCTSCHRSLSQAAHPLKELDCVACHMPRSPAADVPHTAITDHRILRRPESSPIIPGGTPRSIAAWDEPPAQFLDRDLALAEIMVGYQKHVPEMQDAGMSLLQKSAASLVNDPVAASALGSMLLIEGRTAEAVEWNRRAAEKQPQSADYAFNLAIALHGIGDIAGTERELKRAIELDPSLERPYITLVSLYSEQGRKEDALATIDQYLKWNPQNIKFREQKARLSGAP